MPLKKDRHGGGTEKDGSISAMYCSSCYANGAFIDPEMTLQDMQERVDTVLRDEMKAPKIFRWLAVRQVPKLKRWQS